MKPGVYGHITNAEYHGGEGVSKSMLDVLADRSPMHLNYLKTVANDNREPTPAQAIGTAFHCLLLEPDVFTREYCLGLRQADMPDAIGDRDTLVAMVAKLNETRLPKLTTSGTKDELIERVLAEVPGYDDVDATGMRDLKSAELKAIIASANEPRAGLLSDKGTMAELADILRANGHTITLWSEVKSKWMENNGHRNVLDQDQWEQLHAMRDAVMAHPAANALMTMDGGVSENSVYWNDPKTGELCRCRPDWWIKPRGIIVDVKTTEDASCEGFGKSIANWRYHVQHPFYMDGINEMRRQVARDSDGEEFPAHLPPRVTKFVFLAVEKKAPYAVGVYMLDHTSMLLGRALSRRDLDAYAECRATGVWPGYGDKIMSVSVPQWHLNQNAELIGDVA